MASSSADDIFDDLQEEFTRQLEDGQYDDGLNDFMENEVVPVWQSNSPVGDEASDPHPGAYRDSVQVTKPAHAGQGQVGATVDYASYVEYGTEKTVEHGTRAITEAYFDNNNSLT